MKYFANILFTIYCLYCVVSAEAYIETILISNNLNPVGVTYCHSELTGSMRKGEVISIEGQCRKATCEQSGKIIISRCRNIPISPCGILAADFTQPFPFCCPRPKSCSNDD